MRQFHLTYPLLLPPAAIPHALRGELPGRSVLAHSEILYALRGVSWGVEEGTLSGTSHALRDLSWGGEEGKLDEKGHTPCDTFDAVPQISDAARRKSSAPALPLPSEKGYALRSQSETVATKGEAEIHHALRDESWKPGRLHPNLSWTHYRTLLRVDKAEARSFYEIEAIKNNWSARELERQINSLLYERLALSRDKKGLMRLATKGQEIRQPADVFKDPVVIEFLGLPESPRLVESDLDRALIDNLQAFLLEIGKGFAFVARQERITLDGDHLQAPPAHGGGTQGGDTPRTQTVAEGDGRVLNHGGQSL